MFSAPFIDAATGRVRLHNALPPANERTVLRGLPVHTVTRAIITQTSGTITHHSNGVPIDSNGAVAIVVTGAVTHINNGLPYTASGRLRVSIAAGGPDHVQCGVPYTSTGLVHGIQV